MAVPNFIARARQRQEPETHELHVHELPPQHHEAPPSPSNPFIRATDDLAREWEKMVFDLETARSEAEHHRAENVYLASELDRVRKELTTRIEFFEIEIAGQTNRADRAVEENASRKGRFEIIARALAMALEDELAVRVATPPKPAARSPVASAPDYDGQRGFKMETHPPLKPVERLTDKHIPRATAGGNGGSQITTGRGASGVELTYNDTPPEGHDVSEEEAFHARSLIDRLHPVQLKR